MLTQPELNTPAWTPLFWHFSVSPSRRRVGSSSAAPLFVIFMSVVSGLGSGGTSAPVGPRCCCFLWVVPASISSGWQFQVSVLSSSLSSSMLCSKQAADLLTPSLLRSLFLFRLDKKSKLKEFTKVSFFGLFFTSLIGNVYFLEKC